MPNEPRYKTRNVIIIGVIVAVAVPLVLALLVNRQSDQALKAFGWVEHTHEVLLSLDDLRATIRQAESEQRAYILTHESGFSERYLVASKRAPEVMKHVDELVRDDPAQAARAKELRAVLKERLEIMEQNRTLHISPEREKMPSGLAAGAAKTVELEVLIGKMASEERRLLNERQTEYADLRNSMRLSAAAAICAGAVLLGVVGLILIRENKRRLAYQKKIADARDAALDAVDATSAFVASVSHEIRTPMNGIIGSADLLLRDPALTAKQRQGLETINLSAHSLLGLMNDILDLSKVRAGEMTFGKEDFSPAEVVEEVVMLFASAATKKGIELAHTVAANVPMAVKGDRLRLRQVLVNLVGNAVKFTEIGGVSIYLVRRVELEQGKHICLRFDVRDTGPGISKDAQELLFKPFSQVDTQLARRHGGTGLGLAISKELVQRMNGSLGVDSIPGHGATFWFAADFEPADHIEDVVQPALQSRRVLVLEPRPLTAEAIRGHLEAWGMTPLMIIRPEDAPVLPPPGWEGGKQRTAVVVGVPQQQDYIAAIAKVRGREWLSKAPLYLLTEEGISNERAAQLGVSAVLSYPLRPSQLYDALSGTDREMTPLEIENRAPLPAATIIVADDNPINQQVIANQLEHMGIRSVTCSNGFEAVAMVREGAGQLVLMDCQMPEMDGFEATRVIREWEKADGRKRIPIVAITANVMAGDAEQCLKAGMDGYLAKPVEFNALYQALERWLANGAAPNAANGVASVTLDPSKFTDTVIKYSQLKDCLTGDAELDHQLMKGAVKQAEDEIDRMAAVISAESGDAWERAAHRGRGSSSMMGFTDVAAMFEEAEFRSPNRETKVANIQKLRAAVQQLKMRVREVGFDVH